MLVAAALAVAPFIPVLSPGDTLPALPLIDQSGRAFSIGRLRGNAVVAAFIYTRCADPAMCPLTSAKFARLQQLTVDAPVRLLEITLDPHVDTPRVLRAYGVRYGARPARWTLATGDSDAIAALAARLGIATQWTRPGTLVHTEAAIVLDRDGRLAQTIDGNAWTPDQLAAAAREAAGAAPAPLARLGLWLGAVAEACGGGRGTLNALQALTILTSVTGGIAWLLFRSLRPRRT